MRVYFVRHGESEGNVGPIRLGAGGSLTERGIIQAGIVADRLSSVKLDEIVASSMLRARKTSEIINIILKKPVEYSDLLVERKVCSEEVGKNKDDSEVVRIRELIQNNFYVSGWHYSDEENFEDFKARAFKALSYISSRTSESVLVVTHGDFMRMILSCMVFGEELTTEEFWRMFVSFETENTGIAVCDYSDEGVWKVVAWNDHTHLQ